MLPLGTATLEENTSIYSNPLGEVHAAIGQI